MGAEAAALAKRQRCCKRDCAPACIPACIPASPPCRGIGAGDGGNSLFIRRTRPESSSLWPPHVWSVIPRQDLGESPAPACPRETQIPPACHAGRVRSSQPFGQHELDSQLNHLLRMEAFLHVDVTSAIPGRAREQAPAQAICVSAEEKSCSRLYAPSIAKLHLLLEGRTSLRRDRFSFSEEPEYYRIIAILFFLLFFFFSSSETVHFAIKAEPRIYEDHMLPATLQEPRTNSDLEPVFGPSVRRIARDNASLWLGICITAVEELCPTLFTPATMNFLTLQEAGRNRARSR